MAGLGETLREARFRHNLTLDDVERATKVRKVFLWALEAERYDLLPARVYAQGFVRLYARSLGLDPRPLLRLLPPEPPGVQRATPPQAARPFLALAWMVPVAIFFAAAFAGLYRYQQDATAAAPAERLLVDLPVAPATALPPMPTVSVLAAPASSTPQRAPATATPFPPTPTPVIMVSSVMGRPLAQAIQTLQGSGLQVTSEERWSRDIPKGVVMDQKPAPGESLVPGGTVIVVVSKGPQGPLVPNVVGKSEAEARRLIAEAGLQAAPYANYQGRAHLPEAVLRTACIGCVLSSTPRPGVEVQVGTQVFLAVRKE